MPPKRQVYILLLSRIWGTPWAICIYRNRLFTLFWCCILLCLQFVASESIRVEGVACLFAAQEVEKEAEAGSDCVAIYSISWQIREIKAFSSRICRFRCSGNQTEKPNKPIPQSTKHNPTISQLNPYQNPTRLNSRLLNSDQPSSTQSYWAQANSTRAAHVASIINEEDDDDDAEWRWS